ncbi:MAG: flagellar basal body-associated FliL family protein [Burkholderiales bacterium]|nr:flagellar basal body-associated FliL family protein [Burkholderiales bacterium]
MSAAAVPVEASGPKTGSKKRLIIIIAAVSVLLLVLAGGAAFYLKKKPADGEATATSEDGGVVDGAAKRKSEHATPPAFVPLDIFIVNLADREVERFAQIGITLQVDDAHLAEELKTYMPAIRNAVLMILSHKTSEQLLTQEGKEKLAEEIRREAARAMGYPVEEPVVEAPPQTDGTEQVDEAPKPKKKKKKKKSELYNPIVHVHYSSFIIQ